MQYVPHFVPYFRSISKALSAKESDISKLVSPPVPKISSTIFADCFSSMPILFFNWRFKFSSKCRVHKVSFASGKLHLTALTSAFSSSDPSISSLVPNSVSSKG